MQLSKKSKADLIFKYSQEIPQLKKNVVLNYWEIGKRLLEIKEKKLYRYWGDHINTFEDLLEEKEFSFKRSTAYNLMALAKVQYIGQIEYERATRLLPIIKDKEEEEKKEIIDKAAELPRQGFENYIRELKGQLSQDNCSHEHQDEYLLIKCRDCGAILSMKKNNE